MLGPEPCGMLLRHFRRHFAKRACATPELDARLLVLEACHLSPEAYVLRPEMPLRDAEAELIGMFKARRIAREPVSRILGFREFWGRRFAISPAVLDPRPDTETLIEAALALLGEAINAEPLRILDLGTGSGCILLTLLAEMPQAWGDRRRYQLCRRLAWRVSTRNEWASLPAPRSFNAIGVKLLRDAFSLILANPPYIEDASIDALDDEVRCYDPQIALNGGADGFQPIGVSSPTVCGSPRTIRG